MEAHKPYLSLKQAKIMADATEKTAIAQGVTIAISIYDNHGNLKYFRRMDNTSYGSIRVSQIKAKTSASFPISTQELSDRSAKIKTNPYSSIPDIILLGGGLPIITKDGSHIGAIGVSGATSEMDAFCAQAGLDALNS